MFEMSTGARMPRSIGLRSPSPSSVPCSMCGMRLWGEGREKKVGNQVGLMKGTPLS